MSNLDPGILKRMDDNSTWLSGYGYGYHPRDAAEVAQAIRDEAVAAERKRWHQALNYAERSYATSEGAVTSVRNTARVWESIGAPDPVVLTGGRIMGVSIHTDGRGMPGTSISPAVLDDPLTLPCLYPDCDCSAGEASS